MRVANAVCPGFTVREEMKPTLNDLVRWAVMDYGGAHNPDKGLWLWGNIGTGKSTMLEIMRVFCGCVRPKDRKGNRYGFRVTNAIAVCAEFQKSGYGGIDGYIDTPRQAFDELGSETIPTAYFGNTENVFQYILQRRYDRRHDDFTHITTNLSPDQIPDVYDDRIYDRCKEMFNFVEMPGATFRKW